MAVAVGVIEASTAAYPGYLKRIEISGSEGTAVMEEEDIKVWDFAKKDRGDAAILRRMTGKTETGGGAADPAAIGHHGHTEQFKDVLKAIKSGSSPAIDGAEGRRSVEIILATAGGKLDGPVIDAVAGPSEGESPLGPETVPLRLGRVERLLGVPFTADRIRELLVPLGFAHMRVLTHMPLRDA